MRKASPCKWKKKKVWPLKNEKGEPDLQEEEDKFWALEKEGRGRLGPKM